MPVSVPIGAIQLKTDLQPGVEYFFINVHSGTAITLPKGAVNVVGDKLTGAQNQRWIAQPDNNGKKSSFQLQTGASVPFLALPNPGSGFRPDEVVYTNPTEFHWLVYDSSDKPCGCKDYTFKIKTEDTDYFITLANNGSDDENTPIVIQALMGASSTYADAQLWYVVSKQD